MNVKKIIEFYVPTMQTEWNVVVARWMYSGFALLLGLTVLVVCVGAILGSPSSPGSGADCESAFQEVLQRQTAGRLTEGAVNRLANCRRSSLPTDALPQPQPEPEPVKPGEPCSSKMYGNQEEFGKDCYSQVRR